MSLIAKRNLFQRRPAWSDTLRGTTTDYFLPLPVIEHGTNRIVFPYAFCGAILCDVDASTCSIVVPVEGPAPSFDYNARLQCALTIAAQKATVSNGASGSSCSFRSPELSQPI